RVTVPRRDALRAEVVVVAVPDRLARPGQGDEEARDQGDHPECPGERQVRARTEREGPHQTGGTSWVFCHWRMRRRYVRVTWVGSRPRSLAICCTNPRV